MDRNRCETPSKNPQVPPYAKQQKVAPNVYVVKVLVPMAPHMQNPRHKANLRRQCDRKIKKLLQRIQLHSPEMTDKQLQPTGPAPPDRPATSRGHVAPPRQPKPSRDTAQILAYRTQEGYQAHPGQTTHRGGDRNADGGAAHHGPPSN